MALGLGGMEKRWSILNLTEQLQLRTRPEQMLMGTPLMTHSALLHEKQHFTNLEVPRLQQSCSLQALWLPLISHTFAGSTSGLLLKSVALSVVGSRQAVTQI